MAIAQVGNGISSIHGTIGVGDKDGRMPRFFAMI